MPAAATPGVRKRMARAEVVRCPCGGASLAGCCAPYLEGCAAPPTAEALMRSRYTAYALGDGDYLLATWHPSTRPAPLAFDGAVKWLGLDVVRTEAGGADDASGVVEFVARYKVQGRAQRLHEASRFVKEEGRWFYLDGEERGQ